MPIIPTRIDGIIHARVGHVRQWAIGRNRGALPRFRLCKAYGATSCEAVGAKRWKILAWLSLRGPGMRFRIAPSAESVEETGLIATNRRIETAAELLSRLQR